MKIPTILVRNTFDSVPFKPLKNVNIWSISGYISQNHTYKIISPNKQDDILIKYFKADSGFSALNKGFAFGTRLERKINKNIGFFGSFGYQKNLLQTNYLYHKKATNFSVDNVVNFQKVYFTPLLEDSLKKQTLHYQTYSIELGASYGLKWRRLESSLRFSVGYEGISTLHFKQENQIITTPYRAHHILTRASLQVGYMFTARRQVFVEPTIAYQFNPIFKNGMYDLQTYQVGLRIGQRWNF